VISRGQALGYTISMPSEDTYLTTRSQLRDQLAMTLGGRAAGGARLRRDHDRRRERPREGHRHREEHDHALRHERESSARARSAHTDQPFLGREFSQESDYSDEIAREIDDEIRRIVEEAHERARSVPDRS